MSTRKSTQSVKLEISLIDYVRHLQWERMEIRIIVQTPLKSADQQPLIQLLETKPSNVKTETGEEGNQIILPPVQVVHAPADCGDKERVYVELDVIPPPKTPAVYLDSASCAAQRIDFRDMVPQPLSLPEQLSCQELKELSDHSITHKRTQVIQGEIRMPLRYKKLFKNFVKKSRPLIRVTLVWFNGATWEKLSQDKVFNILNGNDGYKRYKRREKRAQIHPTAPHNKGFGVVNVFSVSDMSVMDTETIDINEPEENDGTCPDDPVDAKPTKKEPKRRSSRAKKQVKAEPEQQPKDLKEVKEEKETKRKSQPKSRKQQAQQPVKQEVQQQQTQQHTQHAQQVQQQTPQVQQPIQPQQSQAAPQYNQPLQQQQSQQVQQQQGQQQQQQQGQQVQQSQVGPRKKKRARFQGTQYMTDVYPPSAQPAYYYGNSNSEYNPTEYGDVSNYNYGNADYNYYFNNYVYEPYNTSLAHPHSYPYYDEYTHYNGPNRQIPLLPPPQPQQQQQVQHYSYQPIQSFDMPQQSLPQQQQPQQQVQQQSQVQVKQQPQVQQQPAPISDTFFSESTFNYNNVYTRENSHPKNYNNNNNNNNNKNKRQRDELDDDDMDGFFAPPMPSRYSNFRDNNSCIDENSDAVVEYYEDENNLNRKRKNSNSNNNNYMYDFVNDNNCGGELFYNSTNNYCKDTIEFSDSFINNDCLNTDFDVGNSQILQNAFFNGGTTSF